LLYLFIDHVMILLEGEVNSKRWKDYSKLGKREKYTSWKK